MGSPDIEKMAENRNVEGLIKALEYEDSSVRERAAKALGQIGDETAVDPLTQALKDKDESIHRAAKGALVKIKARLKSPPKAGRCPSCGVEIPADAEFCPKCGRRVK